MNSTTGLGKCDLRYVQVQWFVTNLALAAGLGVGSGLLLYIKPNV